MTKVTLIKPPLFISGNSLTPVNGNPPLALAYLSAVLKQKGHEVLCIDAIGEGLLHFHYIDQTEYLLHGLTFDEVVERIPKDTELIGLSLMYSHEWLAHKEILTKIHFHFPSVPIVLGGEHVTTQYDLILNAFPFVKACVLGEGEESLLEIADAIKNENAIERIAGLALWKDNKIFRTPARQRMMKLDTLPLPDWDTIPVEKYLENKLGVTVFNKRAIPMIGSRGCPFSCTFCSCQEMWGSILAYRKPECVIEEIKYNLERFKIEHVDFCDLVGVINKEWIIDFCKRLIAENLPVTWVHSVGTRSELLTPEILDLLKSSKVARITYSPDVTSEEGVKKTKKSINLNTFLSSIHYASKIGISTRANLVIAFPGQTKKQILQSIIFGWRMMLLGVHDVVFQIFSPYPGSELYHSLIDSGKIPDYRKGHVVEYEQFLAKNINTSPKDLISWSEHVSNRQARLFFMFAMLSSYSLQFLIRPWRILVSLNHVRKGKPLTFFEAVAYTFYVDRIKGRKTEKNISANPVVMVIKPS